MKKHSLKQQNHLGNTHPGKLKKVKKGHAHVEIERSTTPETYWEEDSNEQEWREDVGDSGRKPSLDEYDKWDR